MNFLEKLYEIEEEKMIRIMVKLYFVIFFVLIIFNPASAKDWNQSIALNTVGGLHTPGSDKVFQASSSITWNKSYLEQYGYGLNFQYLNAPYKAGSSLEQYQLRASYWKLLTPDHFGYKIIPSADIYIIDNNDSANNSDNVLASSISAAFVALDDSYSITPAISFSSYDSQFSVTQIDLGGAFPYKDQWANFSYKASVISVSDSSISGSDQYISHKIISNHYIKQPDDFYKINSIALSLSTGGSAFGIDTSQKSIYNLTDVSQFAVGVDLAFKPKSQSQWMMGVGYEAFNDVSTSNTYGLIFGYVQYVKNW